MIVDPLFRLAASEPGRPFLVAGDRVLSRGEMAGLVAAFTGRLARAGIAQGDRIGLICGNRPAFLIAWFALSELGAVTVPLNTGLVGDGLRYTLEQSEAKALLIEPDLLAAKAADLAGLACAAEPVLLDEAVEQAAPAPRMARLPGDPAAPNAILYTSGTTGLPKGAVISHAAYVHAGEDMAAALGLGPDDRIMVFLPLFHANPQMYAVASALQTGCTLILQPRFSASTFLEEARRHRATGFTYVGTVLSILEKTNARPDRDHGLRWAVGGGAPKAVWTALQERFGFAIRELYGMTETGGWVTMNVPGATRLGTVGRPRRDVEIEIRDEGGAPLPAGEPGEIVARSARPHVFFEGYYGKPEITEETLREGWLHTGDRGVLDTDGYLTFAGRLKELIRRGGEMIAPVELELQLLKHPDVADCAVVGVPDEIMGEEVKAVVVARSPMEAAEVRRFLTGRVPDHMLPRWVAFANRIPKTETEKIRRHMLQGLEGAVDIAPPRPRRRQEDG